MAREPGALTFRPWQEGDDLALLQIWGDPERAADERALLRVSSDDPFVRTIVAEDHGVPVAAGVVAEASVHPERLWAYVEVAKDHRGAGLGSTLLAMLRHEVDAAATGPGALGTRLLRAKVLPGSAGEGFARSLGMKDLQRTRMVKVEPGAIPLATLDETGGEVVEDLATGSVELARAVWEFYREVHQWDPPAELSIGKVHQLFLSDAAGARGAVVLRSQGRIKAFAISYERVDPETPADVLFGYDPSAAGTGPMDTGIMDAAFLDTVAAVGKLLSLLVHQYPVVIELDDSMLPLRVLLEPLLAAGTAVVLAESHTVSD